MYRLGASLLLFLAIASAREAQAGLLAYEGFQYFPGQTLPTMGGGTGWGGLWVGSSQMIDQPPTLSYPSAPPSSGDALLNPAPGEAFRNFVTAFTNFSGDLWISLEESSIVPGSGAFVDLQPVPSFPDVSVTKLASGMIELNSIPAGLSNGPGQVDFFVLQLTLFSGGSSEANLWVDPGAVLGAPSAAFTVFVALRAEQLLLSKRSGQLLDEIRVGTTPADVAAVAAAPEPGTMPLLGSGFAGLVIGGIRRRRVSRRPLRVFSD